MVCSKCSSGTENHNKLCMNCRIKSKNRKKIVYTTLAIILIVGGIFGYLIDKDIIFLDKWYEINYHASKIYNESNKKKLVNAFNKNYGNTPDEGKALDSILIPIAYRIAHGSDDKFYQDIELLFNEFTFSDNETSIKIIDAIKNLRAAVNIKDIYANPQKYIGKQVVISGVVKKNDLKRNMIMIYFDDVALECNYKLFPEYDWINYSPDTYYGENAFIKGYVTKYSDSDDAYIVISDFSDKIDVNKIGHWELQAINEQEAMNIIQIPLPSSYPVDKISLYKSYGIVNANENEDSTVIVYQTNASYDEITKHYHNFLLDKGGGYVKQLFNNRDNMMTSIIPGLDKSVSIIISDMIAIDGVISEKPVVTISILSKDFYNELKDDKDSKKIID